MYGFSSKENALESCRVAFRHFMKCVQFDLLHEDAGLLMGIKRLNEEYQLGFDLELTITEKEGKEIPKGTIARLKKYFGLYYGLINVKMLRLNANSDVLHLLLN